MGEEIMSIILNFLYLDRKHLVSPHSLHFTDDLYMYMKLILEETLSLLCPRTMIFLTTHDSLSCTKVFTVITLHSFSSTFNIVKKI
jgi:hypothetical protein